jgi:N-acyl-phosphatidylethanolamine-hydrolysing phospholipase D
MVRLIYNFSSKELHKQRLTVSSNIRRLLTGKAHLPDTTPPTVPVRSPEISASRKTPALRATWLGHACYYVEFPSGLRVLFDPVFENRCSPFSFFGPARYTKVPCEIEDIPIIDAVVISHSHYDHLSHPSVLRIKEKHPNCQFFAPLGNKVWFDKCGIANATELDWWEGKELKLSKTDSSAGDGPEEIVATISCLPCQHQSGRTLFDRNHTLWASWSVESGGKKVWFAGYGITLPQSFISY